MAHFVQVVKKAWDAKCADDARAASFARTLHVLKTDLDDQRERHALPESSKRPSASDHGGL
jgi:hypothetical protein